MNPTDKHSAAVPNPEAIDWSQLWYPGPRRVFSAAELVRAGGDQPSRTLVVMVIINLALLAFALLQAAPPQVTAQLTALLAGGCTVGLMQARRLWRQPTRAGLMKLTVGAALLVFAFTGGLRWRVSDVVVRHWLGYGALAIFAAAVVGFWFVTFYRAGQIESRLRELDERDRAVEMARQLAAAQIQPHFLFNSLASLQHWVQAKDDRAAPMLVALTSFLRATLPLFQRQALALGDEAEAARQYLEVMRLRLGQRLRFEIDIPREAGLVPMPPGVLLTLVENAVEHGVQPSLSGADIRVAARFGEAGGERRLTIEVSDTGPGLRQSVGEVAAAGVGLANSRARLAQAYGASATIRLLPVPSGGCMARVEIPLTPAARESTPNTPATT